jgi:hypothetical protein
LKIAKGIFTILVIAAIGFAIGWYMKFSGDSEKWTPDIINLYGDGKQTQITKAENPEQFHRMLSLLVYEQGDRMSGGNPPVPEADIVEMKKFAVEYIFHKPISIEINHGDQIEEIQFTSMLFPIENKWNQSVYIHTTDSNYLYLTSRPSLEFMLRHLPG